jgi:hypothetical protein
MTLRERATRSLDLLSTALHGLDAVSELAKGGAGGTGERAISILKVIEAVVDTIKRGFDGEVTAAAVHDELLKIRTALLTNDAAADAELDKKFPR